MDNKKFELYLNKIGELVIDEDKIITYKSLNKKLGVHINTAKQLLHSFWIKHKNDEAFHVSVTYLVAGKLPNGTFNFTIVNENDLKITCSKFEEITSKHIYSIQAAEKVKEIKLLCDSNKGARKTESIIKCTRSVLKSKRDLKQESKLFVEDEKTVPSYYENVELKQNKIHTSEVNLESSTKKSNDNVSETSKKIVITQKKKNVEKKCEKEKPKDKDKKSKQSIANFFANSALRNQPSKLTAEIKDESKCNNDEENKIPLLENKKKEEENKNRTKLKKNTKIEYSDRQKRKRIQVFSDSENSNSCSEEEVEDVDVEDQLPIPTTFTDEEEKEKTKLDCKNKRKKRKIVDVTVMTEDGYLETKKEIVYGTDSEEEENEKINHSLKSNVSNLKKLKIENKEKESNSCRAPIKQSSLLSFFKKN